MRKVLVVGAMVMLTATLFTACQDGEKKTETSDTATTVAPAADTTKADTTTFTDTASTRLPVKTP